MLNSKRFIHSVTCEIELLVNPVRYFNLLAFIRSLNVGYCNIIKEQMTNLFAFIPISLSHN